jgi:hypothetical protein
MRDDLHKKAPIPRKAQNVLKLALREADRNHPERLQAMARSALDQFVADNFSQSTLQVLASNTRQGDLFGLPGAFQQAYSPAESDVLASLERGQGLSNGQAALETALQTACESYVRESRATLIAEGVRDVGVVIEAFSSALYAGAGEVARTVCSGEVSREAVPALSLSEDLLAPGRGVAK